MSTEDAAPAQPTAPDTPPAPTAPSAPPAEIVQLLEEVADPEELHSQAETAFNDDSEPQQILTEG